MEPLWGGLDSHLLRMRGPSRVVDVCLIPVGHVRAEKEHDTIETEENAAQYLEAAFTQAETRADEIDD